MLIENTVSFAIKKKNLIVIVELNLTLSCMSYAARGFLTQKEKDFLNNEFFKLFLFFCVLV